jgi:SSS family solute:Na+ symporter
VLHYLAYRSHLLPYGSDMTANFYGAMCAWAVCFLVTAGVSRMTRRKPVAELEGFVYQSNPKPESRVKMKGAWIFAGLVTLGLIILNWLFY